MQALSRRARMCAAVAATAATTLAAAGTAHAQKPATVGDGVPTGQGSVQLFNYGSWISNGGATGAANPITGVSDACKTATSQECRTERLGALFSFLARKGVTSVELFGHAGFPANNDIAGLQAYRALLDKYGLHAAGWHGDMSEANWDARIKAAKILGADYIGSGGEPAPGIGSYSNTLRTAEALNRMGKKSVEAGLGPVYWHNHQQEFRSRYVDNGELKTAEEILLERTDARYVAAELDTGWSSDAYDDTTGTKSADLINKYPTRIKMLHLKDAVRVVPDSGPLADPLACAPCQNAQPVAWGTGQIDFRPILTAAKDRVEYYHQEHDGGTLTDADISLTNLKGTGPNVTGTVFALPAEFAAAAAGSPATDNVKQITITNTGDGPLSITNIQLANSTNQNAVNAVRADETPGDFQILGNTCVGGTLPGAQAPSASAPGGTRASCVVSVGFSPSRTDSTSVARLVVTSNADAATEQILLTGSSTGEAVGTVGGVVPTTLALNIGSAPSFGTFVPATARTYDAAVAASVVSTAGDAQLTVTDPSSTATGHLVNGSYSLPQALTVRAANAANPNPAYVSLSETAGAPTQLLTYAGPTAGADSVTVGFRQAIGASDVLRSGSYSKTLTFSLSTTTP